MIPFAVPLTGDEQGGGSQLPRLRKISKGKLDLVGHFSLHATLNIYSLTLSVQRVVFPQQARYLTIGAILLFFVPTFALLTCQIFLQASSLRQVRIGVLPAQAASTTLSLEWRSRNICNASLF